MTVKTFLIWLSTSLVIAGCRAAPAGGSEISRTRAGDLIRRNLLLGEDQVQVDDPRAFGYGTVHVGGPSGGLLYRFGSDPDGWAWLVEQHSLKEIEIESPDQLPLDFLDDRPQWWDPWKAKPAAYYVFVEEFASGGERRLILVYDRAAGVIYAVEHFADMPGV